MKSMTGYGLHRASSDGMTVEVEIRSWNHKGFDAQFRMPETYAFMELALRDRLSQAAGRGKVSCAVRLRGDLPGREVRFGESLIRNVLGPFRALAESAGVRPSLSLSHLLDLPGAVEVEEEPDESIRNRLSDAFGLALEAWERTRRTEGERMAEAIREQVSRLRQAVERVERRAKPSVDEQKGRLRTRVRELVQDSGIEPDEKRLEMELALLAEKADIKEELVRTRAHIESLEKLASPSREGAIGTELAFVLQELLRECNTTASKSPDLEIVQAVIAAKTAIDRIKEIAANVV